ncbi:uncharacterized protein LOC131220224 [Magnolia sinica]|uniref:uncharacterized protein LOC131220224 n=1 Tax=Magnolia sinica TaxID=86752 RepID=UPI002657E918|nr:uncharacterized protein LOC131220224 [Magnolia sinica]
MVNTRFKTSFCNICFCNFNILRDCPNDIKEAVSTLIFVAARCADLPELQTLRKLFGECYVNDFAMGAEEFFASLGMMKFLFSLLLHGVMETAYLYSRNNLEIIKFIAMDMLV